MEYFNLLGLPEVVQDLIVHEIVHNSVPNDRIQLARTCKYMNEAVKRAKPKKIVKKVEIEWRLDDIIFNFDSETLYSAPSLEFITNICQILHQIQVEELRVVTNSLNVEETQDSGLFHHLFEASKFVTELEIQYDGIFPEFTEFYNKLKHLKCLHFDGSIEMFNSLSHYPSKITLTIPPVYDCNFLENLTKKTVNNPLSWLHFFNCIPAENVQQFLQSTKFKNGCEIYFTVENSEGKEIYVLMTFIDDEQGFEIETFPTEFPLIVVHQDYDGKEKRILTLFVVENKSFDYDYDYSPWGAPFNVTTNTQPNEPVLSDFLDDGQDYVLENIKENDWIKINIVSQDIFHIRYLNKMLESNFLRNEFATAQERLTFINATVGCRISIIKVEHLAETVQKFKNKGIPVSDPLCGNNHKR